MAILNKWKSAEDKAADKDKKAAKVTSPPQATLQLPAPLAVLSEDEEANYWTEEDTAKKMFGMENFGNTCYCNSIVQVLFNIKEFREFVLTYNQPEKEKEKLDGAVVGDDEKTRARDPERDPEKEEVWMEDRPRTNGSLDGRPSSDSGRKASTQQPRRTTVAAGTNVPIGMTLKGEDPLNTPDAKKKAIMATGPILSIDKSMNDSYGMSESLFTALKDLWTQLIAHQSRTGVLSPLKLVEIVRRENELFSSNLHQDAHEFLNFLLNEIMENVELHEVSSGQAKKRSGWIHNIFEGRLTSETRCLTCETVSRRDEPFLDLSIDMEKDLSITACLQNFSASEMLCERNKFDCENCHGLQEAEKRMKVKTLPWMLALHLKRFKYSEETGRLNKMNDRVLYPDRLRIFNTTDDCEDQDRLYELFAVIVHIGGGPYHGHYASVVKTDDQGWMLFDDEYVEKVDSSFPHNFFGDKPGMATAYILFYRMVEEEDELVEEAVTTALAPPVIATNGQDELSRELSRDVLPTPTHIPPTQPAEVPLTQAKSAPILDLRPRKEENTPRPPPDAVLPSAHENKRTSEDKSDKDKGMSRLRTVSLSKRLGREKKSMEVEVRDTTTPTPVKEVKEKKFGLFGKKKGLV